MTAQNGFTYLRGPAPSVVHVPRLLVAEPDEEINTLINFWAEGDKIQLVRAQTAKEALELVQDAAFIGTSLHGLLVDFELPDHTGMRIIREFQDEFPGMPVGVTALDSVLSLEIWARARNVELLRKPILAPKLVTFLERLNAKAS